MEPNPLHSSVSAQDMPVLFTDCLASDALSPMNRILQIPEEILREDVRVIERFISRQQETGFVSFWLNARLPAVACHAMINGLLMDIIAGMDKNKPGRFGLPWSENCYGPDGHLQQQCGRPSVHRGLGTGGSNNRGSACAKKKKKLQLRNWIEQVGISF